MSMTITQSDSGQIVWSPDGEKLAYIHSKGLQAYVMSEQDLHLGHEHYLQLSSEQFTNLSWSPEGGYLCASRAAGQRYIYQFRGAQVQLIYKIAASTIEWVDENRLLCVPERGGLVMLYLGDTPAEVPLVG